MRHPNPDPELSALFLQYFKMFVDRGEGKTEGVDFLIEKALRRAEIARGLKRTM